MYWFRSRSRSSSFLALFALALQLVLTFGHVHLGAAGNAAANIEISADNTPSPDSKDTPDGADHYCAVCALIHLGGTLVLAEPPALSVPGASVGWIPPTAPNPVTFVSTLAAFAARAPPAG
jgi:hypothetical protein